MERMDEIVDMSPLSFWWNSAFCYQFKVYGNT
jgi:hypothetical protein